MERDNAHGNGGKTRRIHALVAASAALSLAAVGCNTHPVKYARTAGAVEHQQDFNLGSGGKVDILWVIDNSQSMCQEQDQLRSNFPKFIETLYQNPVDFHLAVTTTHFANNSSFEKVAQPGHLQSTPSPVTSFDPTCRFAVDSTGTPINHDYEMGDTKGPDYSPVRNQIEQAVNCTDNPEEWRQRKLANLDRATIECALFGNNPKIDEKACEKAGKDPQKFSTEDLFPPQDAYRDTPLVLRASDYQKDDLTLREDELRRDFSCMSFVGTRGDSQEQGLRAAVRALSPEMTGGPARTNFDSPEKRKQFYREKRKEFPNYGFLREDAALAVIFVTDENDCSHTAALVPEDENGDRPRISCGEQNCYFPTKGEDQSPLLNTDELYQNFLQNVATSKGVEEADQSKIFMSSIHGRYKRYEGTIPKTCSREQQDLVKPVCATKLGKAKSGDRYEDFIRNFENFYPKPPAQNPEANLTGWMCRGELEPALEGIAESFELGSAQCIYKKILPCTDCEKSQQEGCEPCPEYMYGEGRAQVCQPWGNSSETFCDSAVQVRLRPKGWEDMERQEAIDKLKASDLCVEESIDAPEFQKGCVAKRSKYKWAPCDGREESAIQLEWQLGEGGRRVLADFNGSLRFTVLASSDDRTEDEQDNGGDGNNDGNNGGNGDGEEQ